mmetsp:Transcript_102035/g.200136  ORF Transcript_102035/g.200136 Transcript_102035/m.200136 type:complete len:225 (+) Transcript_102035:63-737(+)|eukprot:CAMPEP_0170405960 /NCGR_PEP_ID=MMETSP0117_2-20130122/27462_1 /TAXON_ID=400756 /ORGANISM="Durinskia baltica, Strain CSIRO CS-38" /LENGTH=224 /DNA_ID=CAMNT_0010663115 /DNA_START=58 /DNA_END=732 /DNA_ORIENTATION=-
MHRSESSSDVDSQLKSAAAYKHLAEANLMEERTRQIRAETRHAEQKAKDEHADSVRRSLAAKHAYGKDCSSDICHPYSVAIKEILWGFAQGEEIDHDSSRKYESASAQALYNVNNKQVDFLYKLPEVTNLSSGLPVPYSVMADNATLSASSEPYWFWPYINDPNPGKLKHGQASWECRDLDNNVVITKTVPFKENQRISFSCNDVATKFAYSVHLEKKKKKSFF